MADLRDYGVVFDSPGTNNDAALAAAFAAADLDGVLHVPCGFVHHHTERQVGGHVRIVGAHKRTSGFVIRDPLRPSLVINPTGALAEAGGISNLCLARPIGPTPAWSATEAGTPATTPIVVLNGLLARYDLDNIELYACGRGFALTVAGGECVTGLIARHIRGNCVGSLFWSEKVHGAKLYECRHSAEYVTPTTWARTQYSALFEVAVAGCDGLEIWGGIGNNSGRGLLWVRHSSGNAVGIKVIGGSADKPLKAGVGISPEPGGGVVRDVELHFDVFGEPACPDLNALVLEPRIEQGIKVVRGQVYGNGIARSLVFCAQRGAGNGRAAGSIDDIDFDRLQSAGGGAGSAFVEFAGCPGSHVRVRNPSYSGHGTAYGNTGSLTASALAAPTVLPVL